MSRLVRVQAVLKAKSGIAADNVVNNFTFLRAIDDAAQDQDLLSKVGDFYNKPLGSGATIAGYLAPSIALSGHELKMYDLGDPKPRAPIAMLTQSLTAVAAGAYPRETAICISARGERVSGTIDARRRGRVYIGPLGSNTGSLDATTGYLRPLTAVRQAFLDCATRLAADVNAEGWLWGVTSSMGVAGNFTPFRDFWVDDAFDTQRRRGEKATVKTTATVVQVALAV